jgi:hypothetical protein
MIASISSFWNEKARDLQTPLMAPIFEKHPDMAVGLLPLMAAVYRVAINIFEILVVC